MKGLDLYVATSKASPDVRDSPGNPWVAYKYSIVEGEMGNLTEEIRSYTSDETIALSAMDWVAVLSILSIYIKDPATPWLDSKNIKRVHRDIHKQLVRNALGMEWAERIEVMHGGFD